MLLILIVICSSLGAITNSHRIHHLLQSIEILRNCDVLLAVGEDGLPDDVQKFEVVIEHIVELLQHSLRALIKLCLGSTNKQFIKDTEIYKHVYSLTLRRNTDSSSILSPTTSSVALNVLTNVIRILQTKR